MPFWENFVPRKYQLRENMWCLIKGFSEVIHHVNKKNLAMERQKNLRGYEAGFSSRLQEIR
jgi:hypothetical protein